MSFPATFVVAAGILYQGREERRARNGKDRPSIIGDAEHTGPFTTNIMVRNTGHGTIMKPVTQRTARSAERPKLREPSRADDFTSH